MFNRVKLDNGLRIITIPKPDSLSLTLLVLVGVGTNFETRENNGLSHFIEHMCFKGTAHRPKALNISSELDSLGAEYNAFTGREYTGFYVSCVPDKANQALDILADLYLNPLLEEGEIDRERGVIGEEIKRSYDNPAWRVQDIFMKLAYGDTPFGWNTLGTIDGLRGLKRGDFEEYREKFYNASNTVVVVAGKMDEADVCQKISQKFQSISTLEFKKKQFLPELKQTKPALELERRVSEQTNLILGFRSMGENSPDVYAASVLAGILGGTMSSRLWQKIREQMGAAYSVSAFQNSFADYGHFAVAAGVKGDSLLEVVRAILSEAADLRVNLVPDEELKRVQDSLVGTAYLNLETPFELAAFHGLNEVRGVPVMTPEEWAGAIKRVSAQDVQKIAQKIFVGDGLNLAILGPHQETAEIEDILRTC